MANLIHPDHLSPPPSLTPTIATIDVSALAHNLAQVRQRLSKNCDVLAVVKADAYGHGAVAVAHALAQMGVTRFGVATLQEGIQLREAGLHAPILVMGALLPEQCADLIIHRLTPIIHDADIVGHLARRVKSDEKPYRVHIKIDTGMGRLGLSSEDVLPVLQSSVFQGTLYTEGLMTHLADADSADPAYTEAQIERFQWVIRQLEASGWSIPLIHAANSAAILCHTSAHFTLVRPGIMLYGYQTARHAGTPPDLKPVLSLTTKVVQLRMLPHGESVSYNRMFRASRPTRIAVLPIGYADGYTRLLSNRGAVLVRGCRAPIVGRVCMDMTMVDVTDIPGVRVGDEAVLIGQQGSQEISADDLARWAETIPYEVLCAIGPRITRIYR